MTGTRSIKDVLARRTDLSTFLVHLTRSTKKQAAADALVEILRSKCIEARSPMGHAVAGLKKKKESSDSQKVVCFTETPLEYVNLLVGSIDQRKCDFAPYGIALTKRLARKRGANPVWYVDITPGHDWLSNHINTLVDDAIAAGEFDTSPVARLAPIPFR